MAIAILLRVDVSSPGYLAMTFSTGTSFGGVLNGAVVHGNVILVMMDKAHYLTMALASVPVMVAVAVVMVVMSAILE